MALVVDTDSLTPCLTDKLLKKIFLETIKRISSAIVCRVTPIQKALVVQVVQKHLNKFGLAVGDGKYSHLDIFS